MSGRVLKREEAAQYIGVTVETFDKLVGLQKLPSPLGLPGAEDLWDTKAIEAAVAKQVERRKGTIYIIGFLDFAKIGWTSGLVEVRMKYIQEGVPLPLKELGRFSGDMRDERAAHRYFAPLRLSGEWFKNEGKLAEWIDARCNPEFIGLEPRF